jgi:hypothetical protein
MFCGVMSVLFLWGFIALALVLTFDAHQTAPGPTVVRVVANWFTVLAAIGGICGLITIRGASHMARQNRFGAAVAGTWSAVFCLPPVSWLAALWAAWALNRPGVRGLFRSETAPTGGRSA